MCAKIYVNKVLSCSVYIYVQEKACLLSKITNFELSSYINDVLKLFSNHESTVFNSTSTCAC